MAHGNLAELNKRKQTMKIDTKLLNSVTAVERQALELGLRSS